MPCGVVVIYNFQNERIGLLKRLISILLIVTVMMSVSIAGSVTTSAASSDTITVTQARMDKNGFVNVSWKTLSYCRYYRVFYKIDNTGWVKAADVSQGSYYYGQTMSKRISVPLYRIRSGNPTNVSRIYITIRGMDKNKRYNTSFRSYLSCSNQLQAFAPRMYLNSVESARATFIVSDPPNIDNSTKFRVFYHNGKTWKAIGDYNKNNFKNRVAIITLNVPLYKVNNKARFTVRGVNNSGQYTTPFLIDPIVANYPDYWTFNMYRLIAG